MAVIQVSSWFETFVVDNSYEDSSGDVSSDTYTPSKVIIQILFHVSGCSQASPKAESCARAGTDVIEG
jgi:hypothetical protein